MSEDDIDRLLSHIMTCLEEYGADEWSDDDAKFADFKEMLYTWGDPFYTKERNYN